MSMEEILDGLKSAVIEGIDEDAAEFASQAIEAAVPPMEIIKGGIDPAMDVVGKAFEDGDAFLPELILAGDAARAALDLIIPMISEDDLEGAVHGTVVIGTIFGDAHDIGKNIVSAILAAHGIKIIDLGINVPPRQYIDTALAEGAEIIAISSLITTSLPYHREVINTLRDRGDREKVFVIVGGGPVTAEWTAEIGADGYGRDAQDAAKVVTQLLEGLAAGQKPPLVEPITAGALKHG
jgi:methylmalonyl-CoA mutase cobalamin-binding domain/chain|tara:strand:+ start:18 stop:731 length:714 start_codon:yes stop_codon:yes gene_type:complete